MVGIWKDVSLPWEVGPSAVNHVDAGQVALRSNFLQPQVLLWAQVWSKC